ncbi:Rad4-domain-containing protein [Dissoconium aciculare CBS 342.82]|uniref:Rad4-domain-containing protein n=1 Tax=Dissoconium aciculare CBS 342.82 TaxID=1314786 RepID=A0A6J3M6D2_9PEZI|nr:Rad4-domain-containing protein [Dissoconium aciculare CBS 342.82]KAF1823616.1 Rad4-domain-containing protein [Dissoconium aciculare CBS 342.82]
MAPSGGRKGATASGSRRSKRISGSRRNESADYGNLPDVYQSLIAETDATPPTGTEERPIKRRKVTPIARSAQAVAEMPISSDPEDLPSLSKANIHGRQISPQTVEDSSESEGSDIAFEDVALSFQGDSESEREREIEDVSISLDPQTTPKPRVSSKRKPSSGVDKAHRLLVHKLHVLCLLGHCMFVNGRCNNFGVQKHLRSLLPPRALPFLDPDPNTTQYQRNKMFMDGLQQAVAAFTGRFRVTAPGLKMPEWQVGDDKADDHIDLAGCMDLDDFISAAKSVRGSQDVGNQLFCAMLRSVGVNARIVCSLQVLPFGSVPKASTPQKAIKPRYLAMASDQRFPPDDASGDEANVMTSSSLGRLSAIRRRLGQPSLNSVTVPVQSSRKRSKSIQKLSYPVFWVEAFNPSYSKWVVVDPIVTNTINTPSSVEPPLSYGLNHMTYVMAFEADGVVRDVTRRYAKSYNAKTRRHRVEAAGESGVSWWKRTLRIFRRLDGQLDRDQIEDAEMAQKEAREGLPANVLDFKGHPYYALERHLKRNEVIHPKREVGKVNAGSAKKPRMESVYRRNDVLQCRSADKWYRAGREVKPNEQPLKYVRARTRRDQSPNPDAAADPAQAATTGLYSFSQTSLYVPPPVRNGRVPRNAFGNLDIYAPSMIPAGGTHIRDAQASRAALLLRVDFADAVTGFSFKGRHGTAIIDGIIVATEHADAVHAALESFREDAVEEASRARSLEALRLWKRFVIGLRITERVSAYGGTDSHSASGVDDVDHEGGGGFLPEDANVDDHTMGGGFLPEDADGDDQMTGGGFLSGDANNVDYAMGSGFVPAGLEIEDGSAGHSALETSATTDRQAGSPPFEIGGIDGYNDGPDHNESDKADLRPAVLPVAGQRTDLGQQEGPRSPALRHDSDGDSILSHDPEDDDAEPDWLESD